jgi:hypothetical protein
MEKHLRRLDAESPLISNLVSGAKILFSTFKTLKNMSKINITPMGRISYPYLFKAKRNGLNNKDEYTVDILFAKNEDPKKDPINAIRNTVEEAIKEKWPNKRPNGLLLPIKDGDGTKPKAGTPYDEAYHGCWFITLKNTRKPQVVDANKQEILDEGEVYGGCYGRASYTAYAYDNKGNKGVSLSLVHFQKIKDGESFSGTHTTAENDFDVVSDESDNPSNYSPKNSMLS